MTAFRQLRFYTFISSKWWQKVKNTAGNVKVRLGKCKEIKLYKGLDKYISQSTFNVEKCCRMRLLNETAISRCILVILRNNTRVFLKLYQTRT